DPAFNGGGAYLGAAGGHTTLTDCRFIGNRTARICGAAWFTGSSATIDRCQFIDNYGFDAGCLGFANGSVGAVSNSLFVGNTADIFSAALEVWNGLGAASNVMLANCTFADNNAAAGYGAVVISQTSSLTAANCILWNDTPAEIVLLDSGAATFTNSNIKGGWTGAGNIAADPGFAGSGDHAYALASGSPCIDTGDSPGVPADLTLDLAGGPRFLDDPCSGTAPGAIVDMGAYEHRRYTDCDLDGQFTFADVACFLNKLSVGDPS